MSSETAATKLDYAGERLEWAAGEMSVEADVPAERLETTFLRRLWDEDFLPPPQTVEAFDVLRSGRSAGSSQRMPTACLDSYEVKLRSQVAAFAWEFFELPLDARQQRLTALARAGAGFGPCAARLRRLQPALGVNLHCFDGEAPLLAELARWCGELFVLLPREQAMRRQTMLHDARQDASKWEVAARTLRQKAPEIAALAPELIDSLVTRQERQARQVHLERKAASYVSRQEKKAADQQSSGSPQKVFGYILFVAILAGLKLIHFASKDQPSPPSYDFGKPQAQTTFKPAKIDVNPGRASGAAPFSSSTSVPSPFAALEEVTRRMEAERARQRAELLKQPPNPFESSLPADVQPPPSRDQAELGRQVDALFSQPAVPPTPPLAPPQASGLERMQQARDAANVRAQKQREEMDRHLQEMRQRSAQRREQMFNDANRRMQDSRERMERMRNR